MNSTDRRERNRRKVARWRRRHASRLAVEADLRSAISDRGDRRPSYVVREWAYAAGPLAGLPALVLACKAGEHVPVPAGLVEDRRWVRGWPMSHRAAKRLARFRLHQICDWCGGCRPDWLLRF